VKLAIPLAATVLAVAAPAFAQDSAPPAGPERNAVSLQGGDQREFVNNKHIHAFYDLSVATLGKGVKGVDVAAYEQKAFAIFREFGESTRSGGGPAMQDHLKLIPRQIVDIVRDDPHALDTFETFTDALMGPK
jgi:hypothetical protein